ncbi:tyramine beta-hydroxylase-like [Diaphorina citri]|uniref:Tyramine beta-hydroxylase-like n=1 Tax=Diaphorina citri TaxID=121845 RepID=A0A1S4EK44_DIACI|nr:tyramine beta-hydroxylase-like [Diaphorina citri]
MFLRELGLFSLVSQFLLVSGDVFDIPLNSHGYKLFWSPNYDSGWIKFEVHLTPALNKGDWFAIGFSNYGEFSFADYCLVLCDENRHNSIQFESAIQPSSEGIVHHMELFHCIAPPQQDIPLYEGPCSSPEKPPIVESCKSVLAAWAMGALPFRYPKEAGRPIGGPASNSYVMLEVHYNNPEHIAGIIDSSGLRLQISKSLRRYDAGIMELGLEYTDKMAVPPRTNYFTLSGYCTSECTTVGLPSKGIKVFGSQLHTHLTGKRVYTRHIRNGRELAELNRDNHYSPHFQEIRLLKHPVTVLPGDALITTCVYNTQSRANITLGGFAITDEMCVNYIHYYPLVDLEVCKSSVSSDNLRTFFNYMHE